MSLLQDMHWDNDDFEFLYKTITTAFFFSLGFIALWSLFQVLDDI